MIEWRYGNRPMNVERLIVDSNKTYPLKRICETVNFDFWFADVGPYCVFIRSGDLAFDLEDAKMKAMEWVKEQASLIISEVKQDFVETARERNRLNAI